jgi:Domain of unknown function (DUF1814).
LEEKMNEYRYKRQVNLLLKVLPEVAKEKCFALHGGTAINLFVRNMPRLSVDIDLTYITIEPRKTSLDNIHQALERINTRLTKVIPTGNIHYKQALGNAIHFHQRC